MIEATANTLRTIIALNPAQLLTCVYVMCNQVGSIKLFAYVNHYSSVPPNTHSSFLSAPNQFGLIAHA
jgi:hypothetical protein